MNKETRQQQISDASEYFAYNDRRRVTRSMYNAFTAGANWADSNPASTPTPEAEGREEAIPIGTFILDNEAETETFIPPESTPLPPEKWATDEVGKFAEWFHNETRFGLYKPVAEYITEWLSDYKQKKA
jgi:hypothetical protein